MSEILTSVDFSGLVDVIEASVPVALPVVVTCLGIRKGISFLLGLVRGA